MARKIKFLFPWEVLLMVILLLATAGAMASRDPGGAFTNVTRRMAVDCPWGGGRRNIGFNCPWDANCKNPKFR
ncbi:hypothetical protein TIFTF001_035930 [Ficus carica]|uniref:Uncharacterized protein n=1 Tax=Ficus carica TaxID=3494 RepID=A0AA88E394_FICCA|nr:hypothetical protein TIFTF001_035930 [Ficus carica]